jgi:hypothetical protein
MLKHLRYFSLVFFCLPLTAFSAIYTFEYSGQLTDRRTAGYDFPEYISGTLTFDLANGFDRYPTDPYYSEYIIREGRPDFVTGYVPINTGLNKDEVRFNNGFNAPGNPEPSWDGFNIYDASVVNGILNSIFVAAEVDNLDWLTNDRPREFSFGDDQLNARSTARISEQSYTIGGDGFPTVSTIYEAYYDLDFAELSKTNLPEPSPIALISIGMLGLLLKRRIKTD